MTIESFILCVNYCREIIFEGKYIGKCNFLLYGSIDLEKWGETFKIAEQ